MFPAQAQSPFRYLRMTILSCSNDKIQELDWYDNGSACPNPKFSSGVSQNGMFIWGDNADWEAMQVYDGNASTHAWVGTVTPPAAWRINLDLGGGDQYYAGRRFHAWAALRVFEDMDAVFGPGATRVVRVDATQTGGTQNLTDHFAIYDDQSRNPLGIYPDAISPAPYFGHNVDGSSGSAVAQLYGDLVSSSCAASRRDRDFVDAAGARLARPIKLIAYEGGQHVLIGADVINRDPAIYDIYMAYLDSMARYFDEFVHYCHSGGFGSGGAWGSKETIGQSPTEAHKYRALVTWIGTGIPTAADTIAPQPPGNLSAAHESGRRRHGI